MTLQIVVFVLMLGLIAWGIVDAIIELREIL